MQTNKNILIGFNARLFPQNWRPAHQEIAFAQHQGFESLQFRARSGGIDEAYFGDSFTTVAGYLREAKITATIEIVIHLDEKGRDPAGATPFEELEANLPAIKALNCPYVHLHLVPQRAIRGDAQLAAHLEQASVADFKAGVQMAAQHNFTLGFENNEPELHVFSAPANCAELLDQVPGLKFVWDINHTQAADVAAFQELLPETCLIHVSDTPLPETNHHLPLGAGSLDFVSHCKTLLAKNFRGPAILEIGGLPKSGGFGKDSDAALISSRRQLGHALERANTGNGH